MYLAINKAHYPVTVLGPGRRIGIWFQGCSIHCPDCVSQDTWPFDAGRRMALGDLLSWCKAVAKDGLEGITLSGGEPFDQPQALSALLDALIRWRTRAGLEFDLLCYSGYPLATLQKRQASLLNKLDAVIPEPFVADLPMDRLWRGSANQSLVPLSERGRRIYQTYLEAPTTAGGKRMQIGVDQGRVWYVGIPGRGDMAALETLCRERGLNFDQPSWRAA